MEYNIDELNPRRNPYAKKIKKPITINVSTETVEYLKTMSEETGIPYQVITNYYLNDCVKQKKRNFGLEKVISMKQHAASKENVE